MENFSPRSLNWRRWWVRTLLMTMLLAGVVAAPRWSPRNPSRLATWRRLVGGRAAPRSCRSSLPGVLLQQVGEGDVVVGVAGVGCGEPRGVLVDLVEPPLEVEQLEHLGLGVGLRALVDQGPQVTLGRSQRERLPVDQEPALGGHQLVVLARLSVGGHPGAVARRLREAVVARRPSVEVAQVASYGVASGVGVRSRTPLASYECGRRVGEAGPDEGPPPRDARWRWGRMEPGERVGRPGQVARTLDLRVAPGGAAQGALGEGCGEGPRGRGDRGEDEGEAGVAQGGRAGVRRLQL